MNALLLSLLEGIARRWPAPSLPKEPLEAFAALPRLPLPTPSPSDGDAVYGYGLVDRWRASLRPLLAPASGAGGSQLTLFSTSIPGMPPATLPHVLVDARNLQIDPARLGLRDELRHRPGYLRDRAG